MRLLVTTTSPRTASADEFDTGREPRAGRDPALLLRQPLPRPPARRAGHRLHRRLRAASRAATRSSPRSRTAESWKRHRFSGLPRPAAYVNNADMTHTPRRAAGRGCRCTCGAAPAWALRRRSTTSTAPTTPSSSTTSTPTASPAGWSPTPPVSARSNGPAVGRDGRGLERLVRARLPGRRRASRSTPPPPVSCARASTRPSRCAPQPFDCPVGGGPPACPGHALRGPGRLHLRRLRARWNRRSPEVHDDGEIWVADPLGPAPRPSTAQHGNAEGVLRARALHHRRHAPLARGPDLPRLRNAILQADANRGLRRPRPDLGRVRRARHGRERQDHRRQRPVPGPGLHAPAAARRCPTSRPPSISRFSMSRKRFRLGRRRTPRTARDHARHRVPVPPLRGRPT